MAQRPPSDAWACKLRALLRLTPAIKECRLVSVLPADGTSAALYSPRQPRRAPFIGGLAHELHHSACTRKTALRQRRCHRRRQLRAGRRPTRRSGSRRDSATLNGTRRSRHVRGFLLLTRKVKCVGVVIALSSSSRPRCGGEGFGCGNNNIQTEPPAPASQNKRKQLRFAPPPDV